jgi:hypothetical protein
MKLIKMFFLLLTAFYFFSCNVDNNNNNNEYTADSKIADHKVINKLHDGEIAIEDINNAKETLHIGYGHTSHGSQLTDGMNGLIDFANGSGLNGAYSNNQDLFAFNNGGSNSALDLQEGDLELDCGYYPSWYNETVDFLDAPDNSAINVIIWSWCGQAANYSASDMTDNYLTPMSELEDLYPEVTFVYMTCHLNGTGENGNLNQRNEQIRNYCLDNDKWLFDFADIESYDLDGETNYMLLNADDACDYDSDGNGSLDKNWATIWQNTHTENTDWYYCSSAHSQALNANQKAYAAWWLWCRLAGWDGQ